MVEVVFFVLYVLWAIADTGVALRPSSVLIGNVMRTRSFRLHEKGKGFAPIPKPKAVEEVAATAAVTTTTTTQVIDGTKLTDEQKILNTNMFKRKEDQRDIDLQE